MDKEKIRRRVASLFHLKPEEVSLGHFGGSEIRFYWDDKSIELGYSDGGGWTFFINNPDWIAGQEGVDYPTYSQWHPRFHWRNREDTPHVRWEHGGAWSICACRGPDCTWDPEEWKEKMLEKRGRS